MKISIGRLSAAGNFLALTLSALTLGAFPGCATTQQAPIENRAAICSFLGTVCQKLAPGGEGRADLRYVNRSSHWGQYNKILVDPVILWSSTESQVSATDQQTLANYFYSALKEQMGKKFELVDHPQPGAMRCRWS